MFLRTNPREKSFQKLFPSRVNLKKSLKLFHRVDLLGHGPHGDVSRFHVSQTTAKWGIGARSYE